MQRERAKRAQEKGGARRCGVCLPACELTMASATGSDDELGFSMEKVCLDLQHAAAGGNLDEVTRLLPLAKEKGAVNKVMHGVHMERERREEHTLQCGA